MAKIIGLDERQTRTALAVVIAILAASVVSNSIPALSEIITPIMSWGYGMVTFGLVVGGLGLWVAWLVGQRKI